MTWKDFDMLYDCFSFVTQYPQFVMHDQSFNRGANLLMGWGEISQDTKQSVLWSS